MLSFFMHAGRQASEPHRETAGRPEALRRRTLATNSQIILAASANEVLHLQERRGSRMLVRKDEFGRFISILVFMPRDRFNTAVRLRARCTARRPHAAPARTL